MMNEENVSFNFSTEQESHRNISWKIQAYEMW